MSSQPFPEMMNSLERAEKVDKYQLSTPNTWKRVCISKVLLPCSPVSLPGWFPMVTMIATVSKQSSRERIKCKVPGDRSLSTSC